MTLTFEDGFKLVNEDELREETELDANTLQTLLHGYCLEHAMKMVPRRVLKVHHIVWDSDTGGNALPWFTLVMENGSKLAVMVTPV